MAALAVTNPTLHDLAAVMGPDNKVVTDVVEILAETNEVLEDMSFVQGNLLTGHQTTIRAGIPTPTWRKLYGGVQPAKSQSVKVTDTCGMLEAYAEVDKALADLNGNAPAFRLSEDKAHIEGMNQEFASTLFYGNEDSEPEAFTGLAPRYNSLSAENAENIIVGGSADTDNTSIWLIVWGPNSIHGIVPMGSTAGIQVSDKGQVTVENVDGAGGRAEMYRTHYRWDLGLTLRDWRQVVRIPNVEVSALTKNAGSGADLIDLMTQALELVHNLKLGRPVFYCNRTIKSFLRRQINAKVAASTLTMEQVAGKHVMTFDGVPVKRCDAITNAEALVA
jgi:hypothetical protein